MLADELAHLRRVWLLLFILGLVTVLVGMMAISMPMLATLATALVFGWLLLIAGVTEVIHAVMVRKLSTFALHLLAAALYGLVGLFILEHPVKATAVLTLLLAASFLVGGVLRIIFSISQRFHSWQWVLLNGIVDLVLGVLIWNEWPSSSMWVIGLFVGIDLIFQGWSWMFLALTARTSGTPQVIEPAPAV
jgi:uncharacterized membrane protein HdeD (DUF308 family)